MTLLALLGLVVIAGPLVILTGFAFICNSVEELWK
jgi:hypothetical protein